VPGTSVVPSPTDLPCVRRHVSRPRIEFTFYGAGGIRWVDFPHVFPGPCIPCNSTAVRAGPDSSIPGRCPICPLARRAPGELSVFPTTRRVPVPFHLRHSAAPPGRAGDCTSDASLPVGDDATTSLLSADPWSQGTRLTLPHRQAEVGSDFLPICDVGYQPTQPTRPVLYLWTWRPPSFRSCAARGELL